MNDVERLIVTPSHGRVDTVFTFSFETYDDALQRGFARPPDRLLLELMDHDDVGSLAIVNAPRSVASGLKRWRTDTSPPDRERPTDLMTPWRLRRRDRVDVTALERDYRRYGHWLRYRLRRMGMSKSALVTTSPLVAGFAPLGDFDRVLFFARDDWSSFPLHRARWPAYREAYRRMVAQGVDLMAVSGAVMERIDPDDQCRSWTVPNGVDAEEWRRLPAPPSWMGDLDRPIFLYLGSLDDRVDTAAMEDIASRWPSGTLLLAGPILDHEHVDPLLHMPNVAHRQLRTRREVVATTAAVDVCLMAHRRTSLTVAMSPLKLYEYLAAGRPVVSNDFGSTSRVAPEVVLVERGGSWSDAVDRALEVGPMTEHRRREFIEANNWKARFQPVLTEFLMDPA